MTLKHFSLLTDENIHPAIVQYLRKIGFDVFDIKEQNLQGSYDIDILKISHHQNRVIVTQDSDFGTLVFTENIDFTGIIYLRPGHFQPSFHIETFHKLLNEDINIHQPFFIVAEKKERNIKIRVRQF